MLDLGSIKEIVTQLNWVLTLGASDVKHSKTQIEELVQHLAASLVSLWDATREITRLDENDFNQKSFEAVYDYFFGFYLDPQHISKARTHCGEVKRDINRIKFKLAKILHTDLGKWSEADQRFQRIVGADGSILALYEQCVDTLRTRLDAIRDNLKTGQMEAAKNDYLSLKIQLRDDIAEMDQGVKTMRLALEHIRNVVG